jgi:tRNA acetyltransferase TAN1
MLDSLCSLWSVDNVIHFFASLVEQCHASLNEIKAVTKALLDNFLSSSDLLSTMNDSIAFKVDFKRRNCSHLTRDQIFEALVPLVMGETNDTTPRNNKDSKQKYAVNLKDPDFSIRIEVCKTFCGISILPRQKWYKNFNLAELCDPSSKTDR